MMIMMTIMLLMVMMTMMNDDDGKAEGYSQASNKCMHICVFLCMHASVCLTAHMYHSRDHNATEQTTATLSLESIESVGKLESWFDWQLS